MTQKVYIKQILEKVVKHWIKVGRDFVLEEDRDSGHGLGQKNLVWSWKDKYRLKHYFNISGLPDLSIIENCWQTPKDWVRKFPNWNDEETKKLIIEGRDLVSQEYINGQVKTILQRFKDVIASEGQITGW